mmetsp:Transcript_17374/g.37486  ORF Transcript_17374/g.37486 Transcript_17374/m.37486 type:complete len:318 (+) Transcript_17374:1498-2451(+)
MRASHDATGSEDTSSEDTMLPEVVVAEGPCSAAFLMVTLVKLSPKSLTWSFIFSLTFLSSTMRCVSVSFSSSALVSLSSNSVTSASLPLLLSCSLSSINSAELASSSSSRSSLDFSSEDIIFCSVAMVSTLTWCSPWSLVFTTSSVSKAAPFSDSFDFNSLMVPSLFALPFSISVRASRSIVSASFPSSKSWTSFMFCSLRRYTSCSRFEIFSLLLARACSSLSLRSSTSCLVSSFRSSASSWSSSAMDFIVLRVSTSSAATFFSMMRTLICVLRSSTSLDNLALRSARAVLHLSTCEKFCCIIVSLISNSFTWASL